MPQLIPNVAQTLILSLVSDLGNNFPYEGAAIFERILKCATKHASAGNASEKRSLKDSGKSSSSLGKEFSNTF
jgi:hypothetical protein